MSRFRVIVVAVVVVVVVVHCDHNYIAHNQQPFESAYGRTSNAMYQESSTPWV